MPIAEPVARKSDDDPGPFDPALIETGARSYADGARAAYEEAGRLSIVNPGVSPS